MEYVLYQMEDNPKINLEEQMKSAKAHVNKLMMNNISVPDFM